VFFSDDGSGRILIINRKEKLMSVKIRMTRIGRRHKPFFRINAVESRTPRDGKILEKLGHYDPIEKNKDKQIVLDAERVKYWLDKGAIPTETVSQILLRLGIKTRYAEVRVARRARARAAARAKGVPFTKAEREAIEKAAGASKEAEGKEKAEAEQTKAKADTKAKEKTEVKPELQAPKGQAKEQKTASSGEDKKQQ
jgi:small subunit ribosomal protein S16